MFEVCTSCGWGCFAALIVMYAIIGACVGGFIAMVLAVEKDIGLHKIIIIISVCAVISVVVLFPPLPESNESIHRIYSIEDDIGLKGSFVLGSGTIHGEPAYFYYQIMDDGGLEQRYLYSERYRSCNEKKTMVRVYQDEDENPYIKEVYTDSYCGGEMNYEIHVPKNTVKRPYNLDAES